MDILAKLKLTAHYGVIYARLVFVLPKETGNQLAAELNLLAEKPTDCSTLLEMDSLFKKYSDIANKEVNHV